MSDRPLKGRSRRWSSSSPASSCARVRSGIGIMRSSRRGPGAARDDRRRRPSNDAIDLIGLARPPSIRTSQMSGSPPGLAESKPILASGPMLSTSHPANSSDPRQGSGPTWRIVMVASLRSCASRSPSISWFSSWRHGVSAAQARSVTAAPRSRSRPRGR